MRRALLCHCRRRLEAKDDETLLTSVREHLVREHPTVRPTDEQVKEIVSSRAYDFQYAEVYPGQNETDEEFGPEPYGGP